MAGQPQGARRETRAPLPMLKSYLPILVFAFLGVTVGSAFVMLNHLIGPKRPQRATAASRRQTEPYESGIPVSPSHGLFDIEVVFLYPIGVILEDADSIFVLGELVVFVVLLLVAFVYVWRKGALNWR
jgi:NADH-quinone oxidoreductase subunit A